MTTAAHLQHFGLTRPPFQIRPDVDFFFAGNRREEYLEALLHVAAHDEGICVVIADAGGGKTLLARKMMSQLPEDIQPVYLAYPCLGRGEVLDAIGSELGLENLPDSIEGKLAQLHGALLQRHANGQRVLLVIDEAHTLPTESLEEIRMLSNLETEQHKLANILLFGQSGLDTLFTDPRLRQVQDRVIHRFELAPLSRNDTAAYINHRLQTAGWQGEALFDDKALDLLAQASEGCPQRINLLADLSLQAAYAKDARQVKPAHVRQALASVPDTPDLPPEQRSWQAPNLSRRPLMGALAAMLLVGVAVWAYIGQPSGKTAVPTPTPALQAAAPSSEPQTPSRNEPEPTAPAPSEPVLASANGASDTSPASPAPEINDKTHTASASPNTKTTPPTPSGEPVQLAQNRPPASSASTSAPPASTPAPASIPPAPSNNTAITLASAQAKSTVSSTAASTASPKQPQATPSSASPAPARPVAVSAAADKSNPKLKLDTELASVQRVVPFAVYSATPGPLGRKAIAEIVPLAKKAERVNVRGRTDSSGDREQNREIAKARAVSVMYAFASEGVSRKIMKATYCTRCFVASNDTAEGRRANRRVDVEIVMPAKLALHLPKPVHSAPDVDNGPVLLARLDDRFMSFGQRR